MSCVGLGVLLVEVGGRGCRCGWYLFDDGSGGGGISCRAGTGRPRRGLRRRWPRFCGGKGGGFHEVSGAGCWWCWCWCCRGGGWRMSWMRWRRMRVDLFTWDRCELWTFCFDFSLVTYGYLLLLGKRGRLHAEGICRERDFRGESWAWWSLR